MHVHVHCTCMWGSTVLYMYTCNNLALKSAVVIYLHVHCILPYTCLNCTNLFRKKFALYNDFTFNSHSINYVCWKYFVRLIFIVLGEYKNFLTTKICDLQYAHYTHTHTHTVHLADWIDMHTGYTPTCTHPLVHAHLYTPIGKAHLYTLTHVVVAKCLLIVKYTLNKFKR